METTSIHPTDKLDAEAIHQLVDALKKDTIALGTDDASKSVRDGVTALQTAIDGDTGKVAAALRTLEAAVDQLHMSYMRPFFKQTLRTLRTELGMDVQYAPLKNEVGH